MSAHPLLTTALVILLLGPLPSAADGLPAAIERALSRHQIAPANVSIVVQNTDADEPIINHRPAVSRNPASVMKLVSTWAALEMLGPAYSWRTEAYLLGDLERGRLRGDLGLKGYGDPFLVLEEYWKLLRALRRLGVAEIEGDLVLDASHFDVIEPPPGAFDGQPYRAYNVIPGALLVNFNAVQFQFLVDPGASTVRVEMDPPLPNLVVDNRIRVGDGGCGGYQAGVGFHVTDPGAASRVLLDGQFSRRCGGYALTRAVLDHDTYAYGLFRALWEESGGRLEGGLRSGGIPEGREPALVWQSRSLAEVISSINKYSNNVMTRQLLYTLGAERFGAPGTRAAGVRAVRGFLDERGIDTTALVIDNGAGLSRDERASAELLNRVLLAAHQSRYAAEFRSSLSLGGLDGTTRRRFVEGIAAGDDGGLMHLKTGRLDEVSAVAGYIHTPRGETYTVVVIVNAPDAHRGPGEAIQDAVLDWVYTQR